MDFLAEMFMAARQRQIFKKIIAAAVRQRQVYKSSRRGSGAVAFFV
jgi:hypothetical protein